MTNVTIGGQFIPKMHGAAVAAPIWKAIMERTLQGQPRLKFKEPSQKLLQGDQVAVPGVTGMTVEDATRVLKAAGFSASVGGSMDSNVEKDRVAGTSPYGRAERGSDITIYTSRGPQETKKDEKKAEPKPKPSDTKPGKGKGEPGIPSPPKND
jgi:membrane carboxypeptidase/penicillin-binding protein